LIGSEEGAARKRPIAASQLNPFRFWPVARFVRETVKVISAALRVVREQVGLWSLRDAAALPSYGWMGLCIKTSASRLAHQHHAGMG
jgi:hypothetical protein